MSTALLARRPAPSPCSGDGPVAAAPDGRPRRLVAPLAAVLLVAVGACGGTAPAAGGEAVAAPAPATAGAPGPAPTNAACADPAVEAAAIARINQVRAAGATCGGQRFAPAGPLRVDARLTRAAAAHSADMAANDYFSHVGRDGRQVGERLSAVGYDWRSAAENLAAGHADVRRAVDNWVASPGHCANMMSPTLIDAGLACVVAPPQSTYATYWTLAMGRPR